MWTQLLMGITGLCGGIIVASGLGALVVGLGIIPRYAGITKTAEHIQWYEDVTVAGAILGNVLYLYHVNLPVGYVGLAVTGLFFGIYLGSWIVALGEVLNLFAIMLRRTGLKGGIGWIIIVMALGKMCGSVVQFWGLQV